MLCYFAVKQIIRSLDNIKKISLNYWYLDHLDHPICTGHQLSVRIISRKQKVTECIFLLGIYFALIFFLLVSTSNINCISKFISYYSFIYVSENLKLIKMKFCLFSLLSRQLYFSFLTYISLIKIEIQVIFPIKQCLSNKINPIKQTKKNLSQ